MSLFLVVVLLVDILNSRNGCCLLKKGVMDMKAGDIKVDVWWIQNERSWIEIVAFEEKMEQ
jgi:hypothetical protein